MLVQHALAYSVVAYLSLRDYRRLRLYPLPQQSLWVLLFLWVGQLLVFWTQNVKGTDTKSWAYWFPVFSGTLAWPLVLVTLRRLRRASKLS
jgi:rod shape-determining protein MreD